MGDDYDDAGCKSAKKSNILPLWGNDRSMNLNPLILTNIQSSHYFKVNLYELKTYHAVIDEIYYKVNHLEPWEKGSRKTAGQTGMCGGVRGVGAGGIVSTAFCLLYKLFTLKLSRKQVLGLIVHPDSPYIRVLGFMYIRYTQPPADLWDWYNEYLDDKEELDVKAGGGQIMTIGSILKNFLSKLEWFSTLFPRIPVPIQQKLERKMNERYPPMAANFKESGGNAAGTWNKPSTFPTMAPNFKGSGGNAAGTWNKPSTFPTMAPNFKGSGRNAAGTWNKPSDDYHHNTSENRSQSRLIRLSPLRETEDDHSQDKRLYQEEPRYSRDKSRKFQSTNEERQYENKYRSGWNKDKSVEFTHRKISKSGSNSEYKCRRSRSNDRKQYVETFKSRSKSKSLKVYKKESKNGDQNKVRHFRNDHHKHEEANEKKHHRETGYIIHQHKELYRKPPKERTDEKHSFDERDRKFHEDKDAQKHKHRHYTSRRSSSYEERKNHKKDREKHRSPHKRFKNF